MPKYAVILNGTKATTAFRPSFGFYNKQVKNLQEAGYEILKIDVESHSSLNQLKNLPEDSVGFFWIRIHGSAKTMIASEILKIDLNNIAEIFNFLPTILHTSGIIFLDACSTGRLVTGCNNIQFAFANLTLAKPNVQIVAPSKDLHVPYFSISEDGNFSFEMLGSTDVSNNISIILGQKTKVILSKAIASNIPLESIHDELIDSLYTNKTCLFLKTYLEIYEATFDLTEQLLKTIDRMKDKDSNAILQQVKYLVETYYASPNYPEGCVRTIYLWKNASPLACAIYYKLTNVAIYLVQHGADPFYTFDGVSLLEYAKQRDDDYRTYSIIDSVDEWHIARRRKKENDNSKIFDSIQNYLNSRQKDIDLHGLLKFSLLSDFNSVIASFLNDRDKKSMGCVSKTCHGFFKTLSQKATEEAQPRLDSMEEHKRSA